MSDDVPAEPQARPFKARPRLFFAMLAIFVVWLVGLFVMNQVSG